MIPPGLTIICDAPLWVDWKATQDLTKQVHRYWHTIEALGGYWSAEFTIRGNRNLVDDWLQDGIGKHIQVFDGSLTCIWEGFVNQVIANYGPLAATRGPLLDIANRVWVVYSTIGYDEDDNPIVGTREESARANDADSQALWGIVPKCLSTGGAEDSDAEAIRDTYIENHKSPRTSKRWRSDNSSETSVTVKCLGYVHWMNWVYTSTSTGTEDASDKIINVLGDTPNSAWLVYGTNYVDDNSLQVPAWEDENRLAWSIAKNVAARGDSTQARWLFGVYANRHAHYGAAPTTLEYQQRLSQPKSMVERIGGDEVYPWNVLPGKWLLFPDFLIGQAAELNLRDDQRAMFIERVKYTAPDILEMSGGSADTLGALMAQLGLAGVGA